jgi:hypothetical protein
MRALFTVSLPALAVTAFLASPAASQDQAPKCTFRNTPETWAMANVQGEVAQCVVFYTFRKRCAPPTDPAVARLIDDAITDLSAFNLQIGKGICMTQESLYAQLELLVKAAREDMNDTCVNFPSYFKRHADRCKQVVENADSIWYEYLKQEGSTKKP